RMSYIADDAAKSPDGTRRNPFTELPARPDEEALIVARGELVCCVLNLFPYNAGHMMVVPYRQVAELEELSDEEMAELMSFGQEAIRTLKRVSQPHAGNVGFNVGRAPGGEVGNHLHMHVGARWTGEGNYMHVITGV